MHEFLRDGFSSLAHKNFAKVLTKRVLTADDMFFLSSIQSWTMSSTRFYSAKVASKRAQGRHLVSSNQWFNTAWLLPLPNIQGKIIKQE